MLLYSIIPWNFGLCHDEREEEVVVVVVFTREMEEEEEEAVFLRESITNVDPPNAQQAQHRPKQQFDEFVA